MLRRVDEKQLLVSTFVAIYAMNNNCSYNFNFFKISYTKPPQFVRSKDSLEFKSVVKIQGRYRIRQARIQAKEKRAALKALPTFASSAFY